MRRIYHNYQKWEDWKNGMWRKPTKEEHEKILPLAIEFTGNHIEYGKAMIEVTKKWKYSCEHNLTDPSLNKRAWIGHAACCLKFGWPESIVRAGWKFLTDDQRHLANNQADVAIDVWLYNKQNSGQLSIW